MAEYNPGFYSKNVNMISGLSLYIYIITGNQLIRTYTDNQLYDLICNRFGVTSFICFNFVVVYSIFKAVVGAFLSILYYEDNWKTNKKSI